MEKKEAPTLGASWHFDSDDMETWAFIKNGFTPEECESIISECQKYKTDKAKIGSVTRLDLTYRDSEIVFLPATPELEPVYQKLTDMVKHLNNTFFKFHLNGFSDPIQYTEYHAPTGNYDYHTDRVYKGRIRKLSVTVQLTDPSEYEGGDFQILEGKEPINLPRERGMVLAFPSFVLHRVSPITKGTRRSLVAWCTGDQFK